IRQGGAMQVHAEEVEVTQGGILLARAGEVEVTAGKVGVALAEGAELEQSAAAVVVARTAELDKGAGGGRVARWLPPPSLPVTVRSGCSSRASSTAKATVCSSGCQGPSRSARAPAWC